MADLQMNLSKKKTGLGNETAAVCQGDTGKRGREKESVGIRGTDWRDRGENP